MKPVMAAWSALAFAGANSVCACDLHVDSAWIRAAPPSATVLAAYATLHNSGPRELTIATISAAAASGAMLHETAVVGGVAQMRPLGALRIPAGGAVRLAPAGKHLMLMGVKQSYRAGDRVTVTFIDSKGCRVDAEFTVRPDA